MAIESLEQQLERVQAAIRAIEEGAQEYRIGGRSVTKADLPALYKREQQLIHQLGEQQYGTRVYAGWPKR